MMAYSFTRLASAVLSSCGISRTLPLLGIPPVRDASKKSGGAPRNKIGRAKRKYYGIKSQDGAFVHRGDLIVKQFGLKYYPGENVFMDTDWSLRAMYDGIVIMSTEQLNPYPDSPLYAPIQNGVTVNKVFFSVIATPLHGKFRLVSET